MANLTITVNDETLKKARIRALEQNTSVNRLLREYLEAYAGVHQEQSHAVQKIIDMSKNTHTRRGDWQWNRDALHERK